MACGILAFNCESSLALNLVLDSRALVLISRVQASALAGPGLGLGLEGPAGLGLGQSWTASMQHYFLRRNAVLTLSYPVLDERPCITLFALAQIESSLEQIIDVFD